MVKVSSQFFKSTKLEVHQFSSAAFLNWSTLMIRSANVYMIDLASVEIREGTWRIRNCTMDVKSLLIGLASILGEIG